MTKNKILVVDDEKDILEFVSYNLSQEGYSVHVASNGIDAIDLATKIVPDLIILDVMMPEMDGVTACAKLRKIPVLSDVMITFLTARSEDYSQIAGLDSGADDYITKPIRPRLLLSRVKALLRRKNGESDQDFIITVGELLLDKEKHQVIYKGQEVAFTKKEFKLLELLLSKPGKVFQRQEIFSKVWGMDIVVGDRTIDVHVRKIREKLEDNFIKTIKGLGYKFEC